MQQYTYHSGPQHVAVYICSTACSSIHTFCSTACMQQNNYHTTPQHAAIKVIWYNLHLTEYLWSCEAYGSKWAAVYVNSYTNPLQTLFTLHSAWRESERTIMKRQKKSTSCITAGWHKFIPDRTDQVYNPLNTSQIILPAIPTWPTWAQPVIIPYMVSNRPQQQNEVLQCR